MTQEGGFCGPADLGSSPLIETVRALREVDYVEWQKYVTTYGIQAVSNSQASGKSCLSSGPGEVCAERDGRVEITATGLQAGSPFTVELQFAGQLDTTTTELVVTAGGGLPGSVGCCPCSHSP